MSVIIPTYGGAPSVSRAIDSVLIQDYPNFDIIVVDDNEPKTEGRRKTELLMNRYSGCSKVKYIKHEHNKNGAAARNTGVRNSDAKYICLLDDDDVFLPSKIRLQVEYLELYKEFQACYCWRNQNGKQICGEETGDLTKSLLDLSFTPTTSAIMIKKDAYDGVNGFDESYRRHQDYEFLIRFYKKYKMGVVKEVLLDFIGNDIDNQLYGKKLYDLKTNFLKRFEPEICKISNDDPNYKKRVYAAHLSAASLQFLKKGNFIFFIKIYIKYGRNAGGLFWRVLFYSIYNKIIKLIKGR